MNHKSIRQFLTNREPHFISIIRNLGLYLLLFVCGPTLTIISGCTPALVETAMRNDIAEVQALLDEGADINTKGPSGTTALHEAAFRGYKDLTELLLERGADVNARTNNGVTPLYAACRKENTDIVNILIEKGADVNGRADEGSAPLYMACQEGRLEVVKILLGHGAEIDDNSFRGITPLYVASSKGHEEIVHVLVEKGADINARDGQSRTALHAAAKNNYREIADYLVRQGAKPGIVEKDLGDVHATAIIYEMSAKFYAEKEDREKTIEYLAPAAKYFAKASQGYKKAADRDGREIRAAESAMVADVEQAWARVLDKDKRRSSPMQYRSPTAPVKRYTTDEFRALKSRHKSFLQKHSLCNRRSVACSKALICCQYTESKADLQDCMKNLYLNQPGRTILKDDFGDNIGRATIKQDWQKPASIQKYTDTFGRVALIYNRLLKQPREPRVEKWILLRQIRDEISSEEKAIVMVSFEGGQFTAIDWFMALYEIAPPGRPRNLNTVRGVEDFLDKFLLSKRYFEVRVAAQPWVSAQMINTIEAYQDYIEKYPRSKYRQTAEIRKNYLKRKRAEKLSR